MRVLVSLCMCVFAFVSTPLAMVAQDATQAGSTEITCVTPVLPPGTPTPMEPPSATPPADEPAPVEEVELATPGAADPGEPADAATSERVIAAVENLIGCLASGDYLGFAALVTPNYLMTEYGTTNPYDLPVFLEGLPPIELQSVGDIRTHADGRLSADVTTLFGGNQLDRFRAYFVERDGQLLLDEEQTLPIEGADLTVEVAMLDYEFKMSTDTIPADAVVAFSLVNDGQYPHEFAVVVLPEGVTVDDVLTDPALIEQVQFIGGAFAEPGGTGSMALQDLEPGTYTAVCFVDVPEGVPHFVRGMVTEFTVE